MAYMGGRELHHMLNQRRDSQPMWHLMAQYAARGRDEVTIIPVLSLAGDDQNQPFAICC